MGLPHAAPGAPPLLPFSEQESHIPRLHAGLAPHMGLQAQQAAVGRCHTFRGAASVQKGDETKVFPVQIRQNSLKRFLLEKPCQPKQHAVCLSASECAWLPRLSSRQLLGLPTAELQSPVNHRAALPSYSASPWSWNSTTIRRGRLYKRPVGQSKHEKSPNACAKKLQS